MDPSPPEDGTDPGPDAGTGPAGPSAAGPTGGFTASPPAPGGFAAAAPCRVPKLRGKQLVAVGRALRRANCRIGKISRKRSRKGKRGRVLAQAPKAGARRPRGARVKVTLRR